MKIYNVLLLFLVSTLAAYNDADLEKARSGAEDLRNVDLSDADIRDINFSGKDLREANLTGCDAMNVNFRRANLRFANLSGADIRGADFSGAETRMCKFRNSNKDWYTIMSEYRGDFKFEGGKVKSYRTHEWKYKHEVMNER